MLRTRRSLVVVLVVSALGLLTSTGPAGAGGGGCPAKPFVGTIEREDEPGQGHVAAEVSGGDIKRALAFDFGSDSNTTVYLADYKLDPKELGGTVEAPDGAALVTIFLRATKGDLEPGKRLKRPPDSIQLIVDTGGGAQAATTGAKATARVLEFSDDEVCFAIDYRDNFQRVKGKVKARVAGEFGE
jgi:hypothetical protein